MPDIPKLWPLWAFIVGTNLCFSALAAQSQAPADAPLAGRENSQKEPGSKEVVSYAAIPLEAFPALTTLTAAQLQAITRLRDSLERDLQALYASQKATPAEKVERPPILKRAADQAIDALLTPEQRGDITTRWPLVWELCDSNTFRYTTLPLLRLTPMQWQQIVEVFKNAMRHLPRNMRAAHERYAYDATIRLKTLALLTPSQRAIIADPRYALPEPMPPPPLFLSLPRRIGRGAVPAVSRPDEERAPQRRRRGANGNLRSPSYIMTHRGPAYPLLVYPYAGLTQQRVINGRIAAGQPNPTVCFDAPGLLVILVPPQEIGPEARFFWDGEGRAALRGDYYVLLYPVEEIKPEEIKVEKVEEVHAETPGDTKPKAAEPKATVTPPLSVPLPLSTTEVATRIAEQVQQLCETYPIRSERMFLIGTGATGLQGYTCALTPTTPFRGFYLRDMPFRVNSLPPLANAKGRRLLLRQQRSTPNASIWMAQAAQTLLKQQGAMVRLEAEEDNPETQRKPERETLLRNVLPWLEQTGK